MNMRMSKWLAAVFVACASLTGSAYAQDPSEYWCKDSGTFCTANSQKRSVLAGVRFIAEPRLGYIFAKADDLNRVNSADFANFTLIGVEFNLWRQFASAQAILVTPGKAAFDALSPLVKDKRLLNPNGEIGVDSGYAFGVSFFDGVVALGVGRLAFDARQIVEPKDSEKHAKFTYVNIQAISAVRTGIKAIKGQ